MVAPDSLTDTPMDTNAEKGDLMEYIRIMYLIRTERCI